MQSDNKRELFESMPINKALKTMAVPTIISQLVNLIYNVVDTFFIGRTGNSYMVAAVTVSFTLFMFTIAISNIFGVGGGSLIARLAGKHEEKYAKQVCSFSFFGAFITAILYSLIVLIFMDPILMSLGASENTLNYAKQYLVTVVVIGNVPVILSATIAHLLRNTGYSKQASIGLSGGGILNIILDPIFMFVLLPDGYEVLGAAIATLLANIIACTYLLITISKVSKTSFLGIKASNIKGIRKVDIKQVFSVGLPSGALNALFDVANIVLNSLMASHGDLALAAVGIVMKIERLPNAFNVGICQGMLPIVAYNYAAGNKERMNKTLTTARNWGLIICACTITLFEFVANPIVKIFLNTNTSSQDLALETIKYATLFLRIRCISSVFQLLNFHSSFSLQAMGNGRGTLIHCCIRELVCYIPLMYILNSIFGITGLVSAVILGEALGALTALIILKHWIKNVHY